MSPHVFFRLFFVLPSFFGLRFSHFNTNKKNFGKWTLNGKNSGRIISVLALCTLLGIRQQYCLNIGIDARSFLIFNWSEIRRCRESENFLCIRLWCCTKLWMRKTILFYVSTQHPDDIHSKCKYTHTTPVHMHTKKATNLYRSICKLASFEVNAWIETATIRSFSYSFQTEFP